VKLGKGWWWDGSLYITLFTVSKKVVFILFGSNFFFFYIEASFLILSSSYHSTNYYWLPKHFAVKKIRNQVPSDLVCLGVCVNLMYVSFEARYYIYLHLNKEAAFVFWYLVVFFDSTFQFSFFEILCYIPENFVSNPVLCHCLFIV